MPDKKCCESGNLQELLPINALRYLQSENPDVVDAEALKQRIELKGAKDRDHQIEEMFDAQCWGGSMDDYRAMLKKRGF